MYKIKRKRSDSAPCQKPLYQQKFQKTKLQHKNAIQNFDYTTSADRLRTASWSTDSHPIGLVKPVYGILTFTLIAKAV